LFDVGTEFLKGICMNFRPQTVL